jgi:hypothetical protein
MKLYKDTNNNIYAYELDGSQDHFIGDKTPISAGEAEDIKRSKANAAFNAMSYAEKRQQAYPSIPDQLDTIYHGGLDAWKTAIQAVKDRYPKP